MNIKSPITYYGGKHRMVKDLLRIFPKHKTYIKPFFGGGSVFFAKANSASEIINDRSSEVTNFYREIQTNYHTLAMELRKLNYSRQTFNDALVIYAYPHLFNNLERACAFYVLANQSYSASMTHFGTKTTGNCAKAFFNKTQGLFTGIELQKRLSEVLIENDDALVIIDRYDTPESLFYIDPPYVNSRCNPYQGEYTWKDYEALIEKLQKLKGKFILTSYPNKQLSKALETNKWNNVQVERAVNTNHQKSTTKTEIITSNFEMKNLQGKLSFNELYQRAELS